MTAGRVPLWRISGPATASLLVNALLIAALLGLGARSAPRRVEQPTLTVMSLAMLKGAEHGEEQAEASDPARAAPAAAAPSETSDSVAAAVAPVPPPIVAVPSRLSIPAPAATPAPPVAVATPSPAASAAPAAAPVTPAAAPSPQRKGAADGLDANAPPGTSRSYAAKVRSWLYAHKIYPRRSRMRHEEGRVEVRFVLDRAGVLMEGAIIRKSGMAALDEEAMAMMHRASPYPKAPADIRGERIEFTAPIDFLLAV